MHPCFLSILKLSLVQPGLPAPSIGKIESDVCNSIPQIEKKWWLRFFLCVCPTTPSSHLFLMFWALALAPGILLSDVKTEMTGCIIYARAWLSYPVCIDFPLKGFCGDRHQPLAAVLPSQPSWRSAAGAHPRICGLRAGDRKGSPDTFFFSHFCLQFIHLPSS